MSRSHQRKSGAPALELIEESMHLLRLAPAPVLGCYFIGTLPFVTGFLYFWADMSRSLSAGDRVAPAALGVASLFLWMKTWQALFSRLLVAQIAGRPAPTLTVRGFAQTFAIQTIFQPLGLFLLALSLAIVLPFGWVYAFFQNVTVLGAEDGAQARQIFNRALKQTRLWPRQNFVLLGILLLFGMVVFLNVASGFATIPSLLKILFGVETVFTRSPWSFLNTTFLATVCAVAWLCVDPVVKAVYVLRCFYGESLHTGEDLKADLREFRPGTPLAAALLILIAVSSTGLRLSAANPPDRPPDRPSSAVRLQPSSVSSADLDRAIEEVLRQREFQWRLPREKREVNENSKGWLSRFLDGVVETLGRWVKAAARAVRAVVRWCADRVDWLLEKIFGKDRNKSRSGSGGVEWMELMRTLIFVLLALAASAAAVLCYRIWKRRGARRTVESDVVASVPDLSDENVTASQLPEDEWLKLARELMGGGELRLAVRAFYLAGLAHLAQRQLITIAKFKSNRDYDRELHRRGRAVPDVQTAFAENVGIFDRVWYGLHDVSGDALHRFQINLEKIRAC